MEQAQGFEAEESHDRFGYSAVDLTPRFAPQAMDLIGEGWEEDTAFEAVEEEVAPEPCSSFATRIRVRHVETITDVDCDAWNQLFPDMAENWDYFRSCEDSKPELLKLSAMVVFDGTNLVGAVPVFIVDYRLDMSLPSALNGFGTFIDRVAPNLMRMPVLGFGSPMSETCVFGFASGLSFQEKKMVLKELVSGLLDYAKEIGVKLTAIKDVPESDRELMDEVLDQFRFARMGSLPVAKLDLPFQDLSDYLRSLGANMRKDLKRKINQSRDVKVEVRARVEPDLLDEIVALYHETQANRSSSFEAFDEVPDAYFDHVLKNMKGLARVMLFRIDGRLIGFNLFLQEGNRVIGKFVGMHYELSRKYNIYFKNWLEMVSYCLENEIGELQTGQTTYAIKTKLGCRLKRSWIYFRHEGRVVGSLFKALGPKFGLDMDDPDLKKLGCAAPYVD